MARRDSLAEVIAFIDPVRPSLAAHPEGAARVLWMRGDPHARQGREVLLLEPGEFQLCGCKPRASSARGEHRAGNSQPPVDGPNP
jgi:hypothetical protein